MKHERRPYNHVLERKLEQLPGVDADHLWNGMHAILDKKMPQKKERRRFIGWFLTDRGLFSLSIALLVTVTGFCLFFLTPNKTSSIDNSTLNNFSQSSQKNESNENSTGIVPENAHENIATAAIQGQKLQNQTTETFSSNIDRDNATDGSTISEQSGMSINSRARNNYSQSILYLPNANQGTQESNIPSNVIAINSDNQTDSYITSEDFNLVNPESASVVNQHEEKDSLMDQQIKPEPTTAKKDIKIHQEKGLYGGIISGVDLSSVHFQSMRTGATQGLIIGYAFNEKWSLESGLFWDKKRFYDDGAYFDPPGYTPTSGVKIVAVNGKSRIYEWPVNIKYTIIPKKHSLFATAGVSSYFMKAENYDYEYVQNNQPGGHNYISYTNASKNLFSVVNFTLGYGHKLGSIGNLRIEPYLKLPISNLGIANMPIMSTGLNIGFTRTFGR